MITCTLNGKKYAVDFITGRALREMEPAAKMYSRIVALSNAALKGETPEDAKELSIGEAMDVMIRWFCILFGNQFTPDDVLDHYPVDRLMHDIALALMAVQTQTTGILDEFPTKAARTEAGATTALRCLISSIPPTTAFWRAAGAWTRSTGWICRGFSESARGTQGGRRKKRNPADAISTRCGRM